MQVIKRGGIVESDKKFSNQLRVISLADASPYETLHSFVSNSIAPYFKSYVKRATAGEQVDADGKSQVANTDQSSSDQFATQMEKKIAEVEMGFLHLQQSKYRSI